MNKHAFWQVSYEKNDVIITLTSNLGVDNGKYGVVIEITNKDNHKIEQINIPFNILRDVLNMLDSVHNIFFNKIREGEKMPSYYCEFEYGSEQDEIEKSIKVSTPNEGQFRITGGDDIINDSTNISLHEINCNLDYLWEIKFYLLDVQKFHTFNEENFSKLTDDMIEVREMNNDFNRSQR